VQIVEILIVIKWKLPYILIIYRNLNKSIQFNSSTSYFFFDRFIQRNLICMILLASCLTFTFKIFLWIFTRKDYYILFEITNLTVQSEDEMVISIDLLEKKI